MKIVHPEAFWALFAVVPIIVILLAEYARGRRELPIIGGTATRDATRTVWLVKWFFAGLSFVIFVVLGILSLAGFAWGTEPVQHSRRGLDVALVLDVSRSMLADDVRPSRLERASVVIQGLVGELEESRFSMTVFKGSAVKMVPMTEDSTVIESILAAAGPTLITTPGTEVAAGVETALSSFPSGSDRNRVVLLFSDGEYFDRSPARVAARAGELGIPIIPVASGTRAGGRIELADGEVVRDTDGRVVVSRVNVDALESIASLSGGRTFGLSDADVLSQLLDEIRTFEETRSTQGFRLVEIRRYRLFLALALVFLVVSHAIRTVRWRDAF